MLNNKGATLVEIMIAFVIMLFVMLALMQTAMLSMESNMTNSLRDEAVSVAEMRMNETRNLTYANILSDTTSLSGADCPGGFSSSGLLVEKNIRSVVGFDFCTNRTVTTLSTDSKQITISVGWKWKGQNYTHSASTIMRE